jgi:hypothetical protein
MYHFLTICAGFPFTKESGGIFKPNTTLPAATIERAPILVPFNIIEFVPIKQSSPISISELRILFLSSI